MWRSHKSLDCQVGKPFPDSSVKQDCQDYQFASVCFLCGGSHVSVDCQVDNAFAPSSMEPANYMSNFLKQQYNPYSSIYDPHWGNHLNFSWSDTHNAQNYPPHGFH